MLASIRRLERPVARPWLWTDDLQHRGYPKRELVSNLWSTRVAGMFTGIQAQNANDTRFAARLNLDSPVVPNAHEVGSNVL